MPEIVLDYRPRDQFRAFHKRRQRYACIVAHRRAGKTVAAIRELERAAIKCPKDRPRFAYIAPTYKQAKAVAWDYLKSYAHLLQAKTNEAELRVDYPNGGQVRIYGADNPDSLRGIYLDGVVLDEYAQIQPDLFPEVIRPTLADREGWAVWIGTPKGRDAFAEVWRQASTGDISLWFALMLKASETGILPQPELDAARDSMSEAQYAREFECSFDEPGETQFISGLDVRAAVERQAVKGEPRLMGVDVARFGDDRTVIVVRDGDVLHGISIFRGIDTMETVGRVTTAINEFRPDAVFVDVVGVGAGVADRLRQLRYRILDINAGSKAMDGDRFANLRAEMWGKMRAWLRDRAQIPDRPDLAGDLTAPRYKFNHRNALLLESKDDMKKRGLVSSDIADALALTFAQPVAPKDMERRMPAVAEGTNWDPFANYERRPVYGSVAEGTDWNPW